MGGSLRLGGVVTAALWILSPAASQASGSMLDSDPPGARLYLSGPVTLGGTAPLPLEDLPSGRYRLQLGGAGLAEARGRLTWDEAAGEARIAAAVGPVAVAMPPGFAHLGMGETTRGWLFIAGGAAGLTGALLQASDLADAREEADRAWDQYDEAASGEEFTEARLDLLAAHDREADAAELRDLWVGAMGVFWAGAAVEGWLLTPRPGLRRDEAGNLLVVGRDASPAAAALASALVPGAGQRLLGASARGNRFLGAVAALGAGSILAQDAFLSARRDQGDAQRRYDAALTETEAKRWKRELTEASDRVDRRGRLRWGLVGATLGVHLWNVVDAAVSSPDDAPVSGLSFHLTPAGGGLRAGLTWRTL